ncbi:hypothetical protein HBI24_207120 [Parastagonospora nodorum]|nr:hypothetical protein HBI24_207120 [Parastagonospora nodorum]KAH5982791.1 hypothetical protein HBI82_237830 [Parastagonospora nodorum]
MQKSSLVVNGNSNGSAGSALGNGRRSLAPSNKKLRRGCLRLPATQDRMRHCICLRLSTRQAKIQRRGYSRLSSRQASRIQRHSFSRLPTRQARMQRRGYSRLPTRQAGMRRCSCSRFSTRQARMRRCSRSRLSTRQARRIQRRSCSRLSTRQAGCSGVVVRSKGRPCTLQTQDDFSGLARASTWFVNRKYLYLPYPSPISGRAQRRSRAASPLHTPPSS